MANEINLRASLTIKKGALDFRSNPSQFILSQSGVGGPTPGTILCAVAPGTDVDLTELTTPGACYLQNLDATNYVTVGIFDPETNRFFPMLELPPTVGYPVVLSRNIREEFATGTGTIGNLTNRLRIIANSAACLVCVAAFEK